VAFVILVEVNLQFVPNGTYKAVLFFRDAYRNVLWRWFCERIDSVPEVFSYELSILLESNKPVFVSIELIENEDQVIPQRSVGNEIGSISNQRDKLIK